MQNNRETAANDLRAADSNNQNPATESGKQRKKYHSNALYSARLSRESVGHVKPHSNKGLNL